MKNRLRIWAFKKGTKGASMLEYGLIAALIAIASIVAIGSMGGESAVTHAIVSINMACGKNPTVARTYSWWVTGCSSTRYRPRGESVSDCVKRHVDNAARLCS